MGFPQYFLCLPQDLNIFAPFCRSKSLQNHEDPRLCGPWMAAHEDQTVLPAEMAVDMHNTDLYKYKDKSIYSIYSIICSICIFFPEIAYIPSNQPDLDISHSPAGSPATPLGFERGPAMPLTTAPLQGEADHAALPWKWGP